MPIHPSYLKTQATKIQNFIMMKRKFLSLSLLFTCLLVISSCKRDTVYGDITPNTDRPIIELKEHGFKSIAVDYGTTTIEVDITDIRFMLRTNVTANATAKLIVNPGLVYDYNDENGTSYNAVPSSQFGFVAQEYTLTSTERSQKIKLRIKPSDIANGQNAIGISIAEVNGGEVSRIAGTLVIAVQVKNKYDGIYHMKGFYTRTDLADYNGPFQADVAMVTTGPSSVAMYWIDGPGYAQPFFNNVDNEMTAFGNVGPEAVFNGADQVSVVNNFTGDPVGGPFMTLYPGANSRYVGGATPVIYLKYYYNTNPNNRIFADTLTYIGPR
jgi:hypothetical protein